MILLNEPIQVVSSPYCQHYVDMRFSPTPISEGKNGEVVKSLCAFCARMKRGNLYACARKNNCNKLVLAQHLDDCAESFLMSVMHNVRVNLYTCSFKFGYNLNKYF